MGGVGREGELGGEGGVWGVICVGMAFRFLKDGLASFGLQAHRPCNLFRRQMKHGVWTPH